jgi:hypothetical protein
MKKVFQEGRSNQLSNAMVRLHLAKWTLFITGQPLLKQMKGGYLISI